jgi:chitin disaccharide deacetylase
MPEHTQPKRVVINADDFGFSPLVTEGILRAHHEGVVTSTTLAANMPAAEAALAQLPSVPALGVGIHLNASQGPAISREGQRLAGPDGTMNRTAIQVIRLCLLRPRMLGVIEAEFDAQIRWALDRGLRPTHLDSHRHSHGYPPLFARVVRLAERYNIPFVRWYRECLPPGDWPRAAGKQRRISRVLNAFGRIDGLGRGRRLRGTLGTWGICHTGLIDAPWLVQVARSLQPGVTEIMVHPGIPGDLDTAATRLLESRRIEMDALCAPEVRRAFEEHNVELIHYGKLQPRR